MFSNIGMPGLIVIGALLLLLFGPSKLPELGRSIGKTIREFKSSVSEMNKDSVIEIKPEKKPENDNE
jgi:sec-independent protein translocase protein TatA